MSALTDRVEENLRGAKRGLRGRQRDGRVRKAGARPTPPQLDMPQGLPNTPPATQAHDMYEGVDLTSPNVLNQLHQRYGPAFVHAAVKRVPAKQLRKAAQHPDLHPRVATLLHAAAAVRKAFDSGNPLPGGPAEYANTTPSVTIPGRPNHGRPGNPVTTYPATVGNTSRTAGTATFHESGTYVLQPNPGPGGSPDGEPVGRIWVFQPASGNPVNFPADKSPGGVGDNDQSYNDSKQGLFLGQPQVGDLVRFNGPGGSTNEGKLVQVTTGHAIGEFAGQTITFPLDSVEGHNVGGSDHASTGAAGPHDSGPVVPTAAPAPSAKPVMPATPGRVGKSQRDAIYAGGQSQSANTGAGAELRSPDDGARLTPYNQSSPYDLDRGEQDGAAPGNPVNGYLTARERALIDRVVNHRGPIPTETAALKAISAGHATDEHKQVIKRAMRAYGFAVPAARGDAQTISKKLS